MNSSITTDSQELAEKNISRAKSKDGFALENYFYRSEIIYERELKEIISKSWFYACHISEVPNKGDFKTVEVGRTQLL